MDSRRYPHRASSSRHLASRFSSLSDVLIFFFLRHQTLLECEKRQLTCSVWNSLQASRHVGDLFEDLRDGHNLISLLEVLSGEHLVSISFLSFFFFQ